MWRRLGKISANGRELLTLLCVCVCVSALLFFFFLMKMTLKGNWQVVVIFRKISGILKKSSICDYGLLI